jgi:hypothetical protein
MLPDETGIQRHFCRELKTQLEYTNEISKRAWLLLEEPIQLNAAYDPPVIAAASSLYVRACRMLRQAAILAELGQADGMEVIVRAMFDGALSTGFICRENVSIKGVHRDYRHLFAEPLSRGFRTSLYVLFGAMQRVKLQNNIDAHLGNEVTMPENNDELRRCKEELGEDWVEFLWKANTCAGVSIANLADSLDAASWYLTLYKKHSTTTHGNDPDAYIRFPKGLDKTAEVHPQSDVEDTMGVLFLANAAFGFTIGQFGDIIDKTHQPYVESNLFADGMPEFDAVFRRGVIPPWLE